MDVLVSRVDIRILGEVVFGNQRGLIAPTMRSLECCHLSLLPSSRMLSQK